MHDLERDWIIHHYDGRFTGLPVARGSDVTATSPAGGQAPCRCSAQRHGHSSRVVPLSSLPSINCLKSPPYRQKPRTWTHPGALLGLPTEE